MVYMICFIIGILTALFGSLLGIGGGIILTPSLLFFHYYSDEFWWATPQAIVGIALFVMIFTSLSSTISYWKKGRVDYTTGLLFVIGSIPGGVLGSFLNTLINTDHFSVIFGIFMLTLSLFLIFYTRNKPKPNDDEEKGLRAFTIQNKVYYYQVSAFKAISLAFVVGILSGLFGIGGGLLMVPLMIILFKVPAHVATATSMFIILFISIATSTTHMFLGHLEWEYALIFVPGALIGGVWGSKINQALSERIIQWILRIVLIFMSMQLILSGV